MPQYVDTRCIELSGTVRACPGLYRDCFTFTFTLQNLLKGQTKALCRINRTNKMSQVNWCLLTINQLSSCFGHHFMPIVRRARLFRTACGVCLVMLVVVVWSWDASCVHKVEPIIEGIFVVMLHIYGCNPRQETTWTKPVIRSLCRGVCKVANSDY
jgi:hypothetical protein